MPGAGVAWWVQVIVKGVLGVSRMVYRFNDWSTPTLAKCSARVLPPPPLTPHTTPLLLYPCLTCVQPVASFNACQPYCLPIMRHRNVKAYKL